MATLQENAQHLRQSEERLRSLGDNLPDSYVYQYKHEADGAPRFLYLSAGMERLHGLKVEEVLGNAQSLYRQITPDQLPVMQAAEAASLKTLTDFEMELHIQRSEGQWRWLRVRSHPTPGNRRPDYMGRRGHGHHRTQASRRGAARNRTEVSRIGGARQQHHPALGARRASHPISTSSANGSSATRNRRYAVAM